MEDYTRDDDDTSRRRSKTTDISRTEQVKGIFINLSKCLLV